MCALNYKLAHPNPKFKKLKKVLTWKLDIQDLPSQTKVTVCFWSCATSLSSFRHLGEIMGYMNLFGQGTH